jgi:hypothetical protein
VGEALFLKNVAAAARMLLLSWINLLLLLSWINLSTNAKGNSFITRHSTTTNLHFWTMAGLCLVLLDVLAAAAAGGKMKQTTQTKARKEE